MTSTEEEVLALIGRWADAELNGDAGAYGSLLTEDFTGVGPVGFVLDRSQWAQRFDQNLVNEEFEIVEPAVRLYGDSAVVLGVQRQKTVARGHDASGSFRVVVVAVNRGSGWAIANIQLSGPLVAPGTPPPFPRAGSQGAAGQGGRRTIRSG